MKDHNSWVYNKEFPMSNHMIKKDAWNEMNFCKSKFLSKMFPTGLRSIYQNQVSEVL